MNQEQTFKRRFTRWSIRVLAVFLVALTCTFCFFSFESDKNVAKAAAYSSITNPYFQGSKGNLTAFSQMTNGQSMYCLILNKNTKRFLAEYDKSIDSLKLTDMNRGHTEINALNDGSKIGDRIWKLTKTSDGFSCQLVKNSQYLVITGEYTYYNLDCRRVKTSGSIGSFSIDDVDGCAVTIRYGNYYLDGGMTATVQGTTMYYPHWVPTPYSPTSNCDWYIFPLLHQYSNASGVKGYSSNFTSAFSYPGTGNNLVGNGFSYTNEWKSPESGQQFAFQCTPLTNAKNPACLWKISSNTAKYGGTQPLVLDVLNSNVVLGNSVGVHDDGGTLACQRWFIIYSMKASGGYYLFSPTQQDGQSSNFYVVGAASANNCVLSLVPITESNNVFCFKPITVTVIDTNSITGEELDRAQVSLPMNNINVLDRDVIDAGATVNFHSGYGTYTYVYASQLNDCIVYRKYTPNTYTITYNINGCPVGTAPANGSYTTGCSPAIIETLADISIDITLKNKDSTSTATVTWKFDGWTTSKGNTEIGSTGDLSYADGASYSNIQKLDLYARWTITDTTFETLGSATVTFDPNNGTIPSGTDSYETDFLGWYSGDAPYTKASEAVLAKVTEVKAKWDVSNVPSTFEIPEREGFTFYGWSDDAEPSKVPDIATSLSELTKDMTYYAYWLKAESNVANKKPDGQTFTADAGFYGVDEITLSDSIITYEWYRIGTDGETELKDFTGKTSCSVSEDNKNHAIKCIVTIKAGDKTATSKAVSALYVGDTLVDATTIANPDDKKTGLFMDFIYKGTLEPIDGVYTLVFDNTTSKPDTDKPSELTIDTCRISQMNLNITGNYEFSLYGKWGDDKVLIMSGTQADSTMLLKADGGVSAEGELFDSYELVIQTGEGFNLENATVAIRYLPRVYALLETDPKNVDTTFEYLVADGVYVEGERTKREVITEVDGEPEIKVIKYFYNDDCIQIKLPVDPSKKLAAGSYILIGKEKVFPSASVPTDGYITIKYTNVLEFLLKGEEKISIRFEESDLAVDLSNISTKENSDLKDKNLNFGALGAKLPTAKQEGDESTRIRFGTVWYFDDIADTNTWSRDDAMGTFIIRLKTIIKSTTGNDFYNYLLENEETFLNTMLANRDGNGNLLPDFLEDNEEEILKKLNAFLAKWGAKGEEDNAFARKPSFGTNSSGSNIASDCQAKYYYYGENENGDYVMEYSAVLEVPSDYYDEKLIYIPYVSYVKGMEHWVVQKPDEPTVYQLGSVKEVYTINGFNPTPAEQ